MSDGHDARRRALMRALAGTGLLAAAAPMPILGAQRGPRIVIAGGGFAGASCALALRRLAPAARVTLIDRQREFVTGPFCNTVVGGLNPAAAITQDHRGLAAAGVDVVHAEIEGVDPSARAAHLADGRRIAGDRLVVAPGIDFDYDALDGYGPEALDRVPAAWPGGAAALRRLHGQLQAMPEDGRVVLTVPDNPYRCPPGPYERASLIAHFLAEHKPRARVLLLDAKNHFSKEPLFRIGWDSRYPGRVEWRGRDDGARAMAIDVAGRRVHTVGGDEIAADVLNVIPPQRAGRLARDAGLADDAGWVPVNVHDFAAPGHEGVHVLGDAIRAEPMPKSAYSAHMQAQVCARAIAQALAGEPPGEAPLINACYSLVAPDYGISVTEVYRINGDRIAAVQQAGGTSALAAGPDTRRAESEYARSLYRNLVRDSFGSGAAPG
ncbi:cytochrome C [Salinisphaera orenii MK-B5]|uniref:Cytochrome C n=1 Tax=Salinisphaera orenii MK-B5 TaxID=856730 RepID=A0A423PWH4_9GAMM|nr:FCSD flavin-binding domain-containing protein [Salinisphaera orenii]ROO29915.1 cytochrome C [Salinisphaera orenii MK-B5]